METSITKLQRFAKRINDNIERVIVGKHAVIEMLIAAQLCEGHVLIEDAPGTGKTMLARSNAISLGLDFRRLQCTPDLLPNDVTGVSVFNQKTGEFEFRPGPVFTNVLLADEINRATPRTQSALLEAMGEGQVTVDGITHKLSRPFFVVATQNPIEFEGTFALPEGQLDRFLFRLSVGYPDYAQEGEMLQNLEREHPIEGLEQVVDGNELLTLQKEIWEVHLGTSVRDYILKLIHATREHPDLALGASPRGSLALFKTSQAYAAMQGRDYVIPDDVKKMVVPALSHRMIVEPEAALRGLTTTSILEELLDSVEIPLDNTESSKD